MNKYNTFSLQEFEDRRMIIMDDPNFDVGQHETFKSIFSGDECAIAVKFKNDYMHPKTPCFIVSNYDHFKRMVRILL